MASSAGDASAAAPPRPLGFPSTPSPISRAARLRAPLGACPRCALRLSGARDPSLYALPEAELLLAFSSAAPEQAPPPHPSSGCPLCAGCLHPTDSQLDALAAAARGGGFEMRTFAIAVTLPHSLAVRQRAACLHLADVGGASPAERIVELKDAFRWAVGPRLAEMLGLAYDPTSSMCFHICAFSAACEREHHEVVGGLLGRRLPSGQPVDLDSVRSVAKALSLAAADETIKASRLFPPPPCDPPCSLSLSLEPANVCVSGKYRKLSRLLPQSPWLIDGARKCASSVQECIDTHAIAAYSAASALFHSAGREDVDVRMLGGGRPFVLELVGCKRPYQSEESLAAVAELINASGLVEVSELQPCDSSLISHLIKEGEEAHRKLYRCVVWLSKPISREGVERINSIADVTLKQRTPVRVAHRRSLIVRDRIVHSANAVVLSPHFIQLDLETQAGTYVKEFVHGDFGRTSPSVGSILGCEADILQLDVIGLKDCGDEPRPPVREERVGPVDVEL